tara:strand:- start:4164 stop:4601 length:438 start_codon:yes stop_codon:yes gene_type:complete
MDNLIPISLLVYDHDGGYFNIIGTRKWYFKAYDKNHNLICSITQTTDKNNYITYVMFIKELKTLGYKLRDSDIIEITDNTTNKNFLVPQFIRLIKISQVYEVASIAGFTKLDVDTIKYASEEKKNLFIYLTGMQYKHFVHLLKHL